jgi:uncharacterized membrane protein
MLRAELKAKAKEQIKGKIGKLFLISLIAAAMIIPLLALVMIGAFASAANPVLFWILYTVGLIGLIVIGAPLMLSHSMIYLGLTEGKTLSVSDLFKGFKYFGKALALDLWIALFILLWYVLPYMAGFVLTIFALYFLAFGGTAIGIPLLVIGSASMIASLVVLYIKALAYAQAFFVLADKLDGTTARAALKESITMMNGRKGELFILEWSFFLWFLLCAATLGVALIWVGPYIFATLANYYNSIKGGNTPAVAAAE